MREKVIRKTAVALTLIFILFVYPLTGCANPQVQQTPAAQQRFGDIEKWVKIFEDPERDKWQKPREVVKALALKAGDVVADIGAGTGYFTRHFAVAVGTTGKAIGLDIEPSMVKYMNEDAEKLDLKNYEARVVKTGDPELPVRSVDVVFLCNTYHHIESRVEYFKNVSKSLKTGGRVVVVDFYKNTDFGPPRDHKMAGEVVIEEMKKAGYHLKKELKILPQQYYLEFGLDD
jgi:ubiquinone/menaquinone biosynthesis C-methylase UbiE